MTEHVTTAQLKADMATVLRDAEALIQASSTAGGEKMTEARAKIRESLEAAKARLHQAERAARQHGAAWVARRATLARCSACWPRGGWCWPTLRL